MRTSTSTKKLAATRKRDERGEGVISMAIAVLIMAFLGAGMWVAFHSTMTKAQNKVDAQVNTIGGADTSDGTGGGN